MGLTRKENIMNKDELIKVLIEIYNAKFPPINIHSLTSMLEDAYDDKTIPEEVVAEVKKWKESKDGNLKETLSFLREYYELAMEDYEL